MGRFEAAFWRLDQSRRWILAVRLRTGDVYLRRYGRRLRATRCMEVQLGCWISGVDLA